MTIHKPSGPPWPCDSKLDCSTEKGAAGPLRHSWRTVMTKDDEWRCSGPDRSGPGRGGQAEGCPVSDRP